MSTKNLPNGCNIISKQIFDKVEEKQLFWMRSLIIGLIKDSFVYKTVLNLYIKHSFILIIFVWLILITTLGIVAYLPDVKVLSYIQIAQTLFTYFIPPLICFFVSALVGIVMKKKRLQYFSHICFATCVIFEMLLEVLNQIGINIFTYSLFTHGFLSSIFISIAGKMCVQKKLRFTLYIMAGIILLRFTLCNFKCFQYIPPAILYIFFLSEQSLCSLCLIIRINIGNWAIQKKQFQTYIKCGFAMSNFMSLHIPEFVSEDLSDRFITIPVMRQRRASSLDMRSINKTLFSVPQNRRKSLPALGVEGRKCSSGSVDFSTLGEAHGMLSDLLADSSLPINVIGTLRIIADMLSPFLQSEFQRQTYTNPLVTMFEKQKTKEDEQQVLNQPDFKDDLPLSLKKRMHRNLGSRRMSSSYTTTTSATGMPTIDMEYYSKRNVHNSFSKNVSVRSLSHSNIFSELEKNSYTKIRSPCGSPLSIINQPPDEDMFKIEVSNNCPTYYNSIEESHSACELEGQINVKDSNKSEADKKSKTRLESLSEYVEIRESSETETVKINSDSFSNFVPSSTSNAECSEHHVSSNVQHDLVLNNDHAVDFNKENLLIPSLNSRRTSHEMQIELETAASKEVDEILNEINSWDFPIFELNEKCNVLTQVALRIFQKSNFFKTFKIPEIPFLKYFRALEAGYHNIPYHNRIHAADVLHGVYYLTKHKIPGFTSNAAIDSLIKDDLTLENDIYEDDYSYGYMGNVMPELELMALYTAAAMHDFDHPGRTNAFLVATSNPKALLYNDRSVLENHHAAAAWSLLVTNPEMNFLQELDLVDFKRFRFIVIEEILSTDLKKHFDFLTEWNAKGGGLDYTNESDRLLVGQMMIKVADIAGPSKEWSLHRRWTDRIVEEFYLQGEDEKTFGMPVSPYMDRNDGKVPQLQCSFIKHLVLPLYAAYEKAGILPGEWIDSEVDNNSDSEEDSDFPKSSVKKKAAFNVVIDNIQKNHDRWLKIISDEEEYLVESSQQNSYDCNNEVSNGEHDVLSEEHSISTGLDSFNNIVNEKTSES
ncbi:cGMP-inhibited 3',5'-cyclic phosphodiesterase 3A isoform X4 [Hydra vulgaris]|uniref:cGMP-inhibited 3',5'-cyclic phosphodiesterase 3A isoform X4 n=1 Tax=Hydra vulgaris TaxID=6087 RepID=UPI0032EA29AC